MTETYQFVGRIIRPVSNGFTHSDVTLIAAVSGRMSCFVRNLQTGELLLPVPEAANVELTAENHTAMMAGFPARLGNQAGELLNIFTECGIVDMAQMPPAIGMLEAGANSNVVIDGLRLPGWQKALFVMSGGEICHAGLGFDRIEVGYRLPVDADAGTPEGSTPKEVGITFGPVVPVDQPGPKPYAFASEAYSFGAIQLVPREAMAALLANDGVNLDPNDVTQWSPFYLIDHGLASRLTDITLEGVSR